MYYESFFVQVVRGFVKGARVKVVRGSNPDVDTTVRENLWPFNGEIVYPTAGEQWEISSSSINDTLAGTGAQRVLLRYLDSNYAEQEEEIDLNGITVVPTVSIDCFRPIDLTVINVGVLGSNEGAITCTVAGAGANRIGINAGENVSLQCMYTVPAGKRAMLLYGYVDTGKDDDVFMTSYITEGEGSIFYKQIPVEIFESSGVLSPVAPYGYLEEKSDWVVYAQAASVNATVGASFQFLEFDL